MLDPILGEVDIGIFRGQFFASVNYQESGFQNLLMNSFPMNCRTTLPICVFSAYATGHFVAKSIVVMMYFFLLCFPGIGHTMSRAHTLKGSCLWIDSTDIGGVLLFANFPHTLH